MVNAIVLVFVDPTSFSLYHTAGRGPHTGGTSGYSLTIHIYNNYFNDITGHAIDADTGSKLLVEGNYFNNVKTPSTGKEAHQATLVSPMTIHIYNNYFNDITGHAIDADTGSKLLVEGNYFNNVKTPSTGNTNGAVFAPTSSPMNSQCSTTLGRNCVSNTLAGSGSLTNTANSGAISAFTASVVKSASVMDPGAVSSYVLANAGLGKVN
ncbi:hypothetical protein RSAG8_11868, partial [Rhizoctonia solani AG-8 WAC10335]